MKNQINKGMIQLIIILSICVALAPFVAQATENGGGAYPNGAEDSMAGAFPPPGFYVINYTNFYTASKLKDGHGDEIHVPFKVDAFADCIRLIYSSKLQLLGGNAGAHLILPFVTMDVETPAGKGNRTGFGDMTFGPAIAWHWLNFHAIACLDIDMPTGGFDKDRIANIGRNYWTFEPLLALTYLSNTGIELTGKFMYDINTENTETDYRSGHEFHFDYALAYHCGPWTVGANGYYYKQVTDDKLDGKKVGSDGYKGQVFAIGPVLKYDLAKNMGLTLKYQKEMFAENRAEGDKIWMKFFYAF